MKLGFIVVFFSCCFSGVQFVESRILPQRNHSIPFQFPYVEKDIGKTSLDCAAQSNGIYSFTLPAESPLGPVNVLFVQHNGNRLMPYATTALHNSLNHEQAVDRNDNFRMHPCSAIALKQTTCSNTFKMTAAQQALTGRTAFDRGHLSPFNPFRFSQSAADATFYCVNVAPQEPYTNQAPWNTIEGRTHEKLKDKAGYVITGVCDRDSSDGLTADGWRVPECFFKLICYKDNGGVARVVGFLADNHLFHKDDAAAKALRTAETTKPRHQSEILAKMTSSSFIQAAWRNAETYLLENRRETNAPSPMACINALTAPNAILVEWGLK